MNVVIASVSYQSMDYDLKVSIKELIGLCEATNYQVIGQLHQNLDRINRETFFNRGKIDELKSLMVSLGVSIVIFNEELSGLQLRNLTEILDCEVLDRTSLILRIFSSRAKTKEALLQVAIASKQYELTHLVGQHESIYSQQGGSGFRGAGETQLELDRREIRRSINALQNDLKLAVRQRKTQRSQRKKNAIKQVALVGYTNSGKSTLMNRLINNTNKQVFAHDMLFATLETSSRMITATNYQYILTDTVGFISQLPTTLIKAFRSTLEEVSEADLLIHVVDVSNSDYLQQLDTTNQVLKDLHCEQIPMLYVYNKMDLVKVESLIPKFPCVMISAQTGDNLDLLEQSIKEQLFRRQQHQLYIPYEDYQVYGELKQLDLIVEQSEKHEGVIVKVELEEQQLRRYARYIWEGDI
jgi:GTPase